VVGRQVPPNLKLMNLVSYVRETSSLVHNVLLSGHNAYIIKREFTPMFRTAE